MSPRASACVMVLTRSLVMAVALGACGRTCKKDHPHVPYSVEDSKTSSAEDAGDRSVDASVGLPGVEPALVAPPKSTRWNVRDRELVAPPNREFALALPGDFDTDGSSDALVIALSPSDSEDPPAAEVLLYTGASRTFTVIAAAPALPSGTTCKPTVRLERVAPRSALAELGSTCEGGNSWRKLVVVRLTKTPGVAFDLGVMDPKGAPALTVDVDGTDRDRDGIDDVTLRLMLEGGSPPFEPGPRVSAKVAFFDRPAGPSRDLVEPEASLRAVATLASSRASKAKDAPAVPLLVHQMRMLFRAMCVEAGAPRLVESRSLPSGGNGALLCGASKSLEDAGLAEVRAWVGQGNALRALTAAETAQLPPAARTPARTSELATLLAQVAPVVEASSGQTLSVIPKSMHSPHPEWGAIAFEGDGKLLIQTQTATVRWDPASGESHESDVAAWGLQVLSPDGRTRWMDAYNACDGVALRAAFGSAGAERDVREVLLPIAPTLGSRCAGRGESTTAVPLAWGNGGLEAVIAGQLLLLRPEASLAMAMATPLGQARSLGSPRSPSGRAMALATSQGVLVTTTKSARYRSSQFEPYGELHHCTVSDDASRIACIKRDRVVFATFAPM